VTLEFDYDEGKNETNYEKHGIDFETARRVFDDPFQQSTQDRIVDGEERWQTVGMVDGVVLLLVAHTWNEHDETVHVRIISARKATPHERKRYENEA
jgi:uncharacterized DUF497 family protein